MSERSLAPDPATRKLAPALCIGLILFLPLLTVCSCTTRSGRATAEHKPIRVAFNTWIGYSSFYIAQEQGTFDKLGLNVQTSVIDPLAEKNAAMLRGDLDAMGGTIDSTIISTTSGVKGKIVYMFDRSKGADGILVSQRVRSVDDLKSVPVAVEEGFVGHFFLLYYLDKHRIPPQDVKIVPMTTDQAGAAFAAGKVDAAATWQPYLTTALERKGSRVLVSSAQLEPILADTLFVSNSVLQQRSADILALVRALQQANDYWLAHPAQANSLVAKKWKMSPDEVAKIMKTDELYRVSDQRTQFGLNDTDGDLYKYLSKAAELWLRAGVTHQNVNPKQLMDGSAVRKLDGYYNP